MGFSTVPDGAQRRPTVSASAPMTSRVRIQRACRHRRDTPPCGCVLRPAGVRSRAKDLVFGGP